MAMEDTNRTQRSDLRNSRIHYDRTGVETMVSEPTLTTVQPRIHDMLIEA